MSLWKVSDDATGTLMVAHYKRLQASEGRVAAMRRVVRDAARTTEGRRKWYRQEGRMTNDYRHHYYWAAFIQ